MKQKKSVILLLAFALLIIPLVSSAECSLNVSMINQDPYPAIPGDSVKTVFQIDGLENPECGIVRFEVKETFPFSIDPSTKNPIEIQSGTYSRKYSSFYLATYQLRVNENALEGDNPIEIVYGKKGSSEYLEEFNIHVKDTKADFEIYVKDYNYNTRELTFEILNIEDVDIEALTIEIPKQENIEIKGANRKVIGDLDSNEYTTANFEATILQGEIPINVNIIYTDSINVRRQGQETVSYDSSYFEGGNGESSSAGIWITIIIVLIVAWFVYRKVKKNKAKKKRMMQQRK
jgi:hypothetical protein